MRASLTDILARILARKSARVGQVGGQVGEDVRVAVGPMEFQLKRGQLYGIRPTLLDRSWFNVRTTKWGLSLIGSLG